MSLSPENADDVPREIDSRIWRACAGASVQIPTLHSRVYYFPQGHVEHCCGLSSPLLSNLPSGYNPVPCVVSAIELLADPITDEVFAYLRLQPMSPDQFYPTRLPTFGSSLVEENNKVVTFAKILTPSDANNGGGFSVPRYCADSVFPQLNFDDDPPVQKLFITDIHGVVWDFRHIYRGTPRRHLLTTGWSKFVNNKKLISGDSVVFMRKSPHEMFMGVRRAPVSSTGGGTSFYGGDESSSYYNQNSGGAADEDDGVGKKVFRRIGKGKLTTGAVSEAINRAAKGQPFEVVYYPTAGWSEFVVRAEDVEASMTIFWAPGTRVKMAMETEDSSRITWFQGTVSSTYHETGPWRGSPWKQLQITWDEPEILQNVKRVNPWQVEVVAGANQLHPTFPPPKRMRYPPTGGFLNGDEGEFVYYDRGQSSSAPPPEPSPYLYSYTTFPAGMQGARHYEFGAFNSTRFIGENPPQLFTNNFFSPHPESERVSTEMNSGRVSTEMNSGRVSTEMNSGRVSTEMNSGRVSTEMNSGRVSTEMNSGRVSTEMNSGRVSTEMNSGRVSTEMNSGSSPSDNLSPTSNNTNQSSGNELVVNRGPVAAKTNSFQLFGQIITVQEPSESGVAESEDVSKESSGDESLTNTQLSL